MTDNQEEYENIPSSVELQHNAVVIGFAKMEDERKCKSPNK